MRELQDVLAGITVTGPRFDAVVPGVLPAAFRKTVSAERRSTLADVRENLERAVVRDILGRRRNVARTAGKMRVTRQGLAKRWRGSRSTGSVRAATAWPRAVVEPDWAGVQARCRSRSWRN